jgi:23S rRNA (uracil1939-C5)-methyltransferase
VGAWSYRAPPEAFFQVHPAQAARLVSHVIECVNRHGAARHTPPEAEPIAVLDLFCGVGLFTLPLAAAGHRVLGLELAGHAVRAARRTAREAQERGGFGSGRRPEFKVRDLDAKGALEEAAKSFGQPDAVVADPPRRGLSGHLVHSLLALRPPSIVYVSCDGGTFARDAGRLAERFALEHVMGFDLFPQTHHLEVVGIFTARREGAVLW